jgi:4-amino-4-deoxy-L-arabinose transferase-like glycosyltransferase
VSTRLVWAAIVLVYLAGAIALALTKRPWVDEAWFATPALNLLTRGVMGTSNLETAGTTLTGIDQYTYWMPPLHFVLQAGWYALMGFGIMQMRALTMLWGLVALVSWWYVVLRLTSSARTALLTAALMATDFIFIRGASDGRMDVMCAALSAMGLAAYLHLRDRRLAHAVLAAAACTAASLLTHPNGIIGGASLVLLALAFDASRLRARHVALAAVPYVVGFAGWGIYILQAPDLFREQLGGNVSGRTTGVWSLLQHVTDTYAPAFGLRAHWAGPLVHLRALILVAYLTGVVGLLLTGVLRRQRGVRLMLMLTATTFVTMTFAGGANQHDYLVHIVPLYLACLATWAVWRWSHGWYALATTVVGGLVLLQLGGIAQRVRLDPYGERYMPTIEFLQREVPPDATIFGSSELGFHLGFDRRLVDDTVLGYRSGRRADYIVVDDRYTQWFHDILSGRPAIQQHILRLLTTEYDKVYENPGFTVYKRK